MTSNKKAIGFALVAVFFWSTVATAFKLALAEQSLYQLLFVANVVTLIILVPILVFQHNIKAALLSWKSHWRLSLMMGLINPFAYYLILFRAYELLPAQVAQPINYTWAIVLSVLAVPILGHKFTRRDGISMAVAYMGVVVISIGGYGENQPVTFIGIGLALFSTVLWAVYWLLNTKDKRDPIVALFQNFLFAVPFTFCLFMWQASERVWTVSSIASGVYVGLFEMGISFVFWLLALKYTSRASVVGNLIFISPFVSLIFISQILGETIVPMTGIGLLLIVFALVYQNRKST